MEAIFFENGTYVAIENNVDETIEESSLIISSGDKDVSYLFGGRVIVQYYCRGIIFKIDGIEILEFCPADNFMHYSERLSFSETTAYLNQIEQLGVDTFLGNYKKSLDYLKTELKEYADTLRGDLAEKEDSKKRSLLENIEKVLVCTIIPLLFSLMVNMNAGLDNHVYQEAYDNVVNTYFAD